MKKYLIYSLFIILVGAVAFSIIKQTSTQKVSSKLDRLPCHKNITSFERAYDTKKLSEAKELLLSGNYRIKSDIDKAQYMKSTLFNFIKLEDTDRYLYNFINRKNNTKNTYSNGVTVDYTIFENDIDDPKKKTDNCKLFRGYIVLKIKDSNNKVLYQVQIDFIKRDGKDIFKTLDCALNSFLTY